MGRKKSIIATFSGPRAEKKKGSNNFMKGCFIFSPQTTDMVDIFDIYSKYNGNMVLLPLLPILPKVEFPFIMQALFENESS